MKPRKTLRHVLAVAGSSLLAASSASATTIYWDGTSASWNAAANWTTAAGAATPNPGAVPGASDDTIFNRTGQNGSIAISLDADQAAQSLTFNSTGTTTIRGNTSSTTPPARSLSIGSGGITKNSGSGAVEFGSGGNTFFGVVNIALSADQTWTNNSTSALSIGTRYFSSATDANVALGAFNLTIDGTGNTNIGVSNQAEAVLTGTGTLTKNGAGVLQMGGANSGYSGNVFINGGVVNTGDATANGTGTGNISINGGVLETRWSTGISRAQGTLAGQIQITGGVSGLSGGGSGSGSATHNIGAITWGSSTFNPTEFVLQSANSGGGTTTLSSAINLNGDDPGATPVSGVVWRTIRSNQGNLSGSGTFSGAITNSGTTNMAGLIKTGVGQHILSGTNTYNGGTQVNQGILTATTTAALPGWNTSGKVTVAGNATLGVRTGASWTAANIDTLRGAVTWSATSSRLGIDTTAANFSYGSNITEALTLNKIGTNTLTLTGTNTYTGGTILSAGTLSVGSATAIPSTGTISFNGGTIQSSDATLRTLSNVIAVNADITVGTTGNLTFSDTGSTALGASRTFTINGGNTTFAQAFTGSGFGINKAGAGILTLTGNNTFTGATNINAGTIVLNNDGDVTGSAVTFGGNNTGLTITGGSGVTSTWNAGGGSFGTSNNTFSGIQVLIDGAGTAGSAVVTNVGTLIWGRTASNSTITLTNGGQINVNGEIRIGNPYYSEAGGANLTIGGGTATSTFTGNNPTTSNDFYIGYGERTGSKNNVVTVSSGGVLTGIRDMVVGHVFDAQNNANPSTNNQLLVTGTGTASMRGISVGFANASSSRTANANIVSVTGGGTLTSTGAILIGRANLAGSQSNSNTMTISGTSSTWNAGNQNVTVGATNNATATSNNNILTVGAGAVVSNVGALTVGSGSGTETGNQLVVNGSLTATSVSVSTGNILSGSGTINGAVTVNGTLTPGNSIGTLAVTGDLNISGLAGGTGGLSFELGSIASSDKITVTGGLNIGTLNFADFVFTDVGGLQNGTYVLISGATSLTGDLDATPGSLTGTIAPGITGTLQRSGGGTGNDIELVVTGVGVGSPYDTWAGGADFDDDANNDGVSNGLAFLLGAGGPNDNALGLLPDVEEDGSGNLVLSFTCLDDASRGDAVLYIEHSGDLGIGDPWQSSVAVDDDGNVLANGVTINATVNVGDSDLNDVEAIISSAGAVNGKLFGRLRAEKP